MSVGLNAVPTWLKVLYQYKSTFFTSTKVRAVLVQKYKY